jgi:hypothetical protein
MVVKGNYKFKIDLMKTKIFLMIAALGVLSFSSCNKDSGVIEQTSLDLADDDAVTEVAFNDVFNTVDNASIIMENKMGSVKGDLASEVVLADSCPVITITSPVTGIWPKTITIDYGSGCSGFNGSTRSGKIIVIVTNRRNVLNATRTVTFNNYFFNSIKLEGTKELKNLGPNSSQNMEFSIKLTGGKLTLPNGKTVERAFEHKREWIAGWGTKSIWDDECLISGTASGKNINGITYTNTILTALHWTRVCEFLVSGTIKYERSGVEPVVLDYGTGNCDAKAVVTRGTESKEILLKHNHRSTGL